MRENPYQSPATVEMDQAPSGSRADSPPWGRLDIIWDLCFIFGFVWFFGSAVMYIALLTISIFTTIASYEYEFPNSSSQVSESYYNLAGYTSFISCSAVGLIEAVVVVVRRRAEFRRNWPDWRTASKYVLWSTIIMTPAWVVYIWAAESYQHRLPVEGEWVAISAGALLGIIHGYICKRGWCYQRPTRLPESAANTTDTA